MTKSWQPVFLAEDARLPLSKTGKRKVSGFRCEDCKVTLRNISSLLAHLDKTHRIHIWYEKGLTKKRVFFDGILDETPGIDKTEKDLPVPVTKKSIPLSQRLHEPRKAQSSVSLENAKKGKEELAIWRKPIEKRVKRQTILNECS